MKWLDKPHRMVKRIFVKWFNEIKRIFPSNYSSECNIIPLRGWTSGWKFTSPRDVYHLQAKLGDIKSIWYPESFRASMANCTPWQSQKLWVVVENHTHSASTLIYPTPSPTYPMQVRQNLSNTVMVGHLVLRESPVLSWELPVRTICLFSKHFYPLLVQVILGVTACKLQTLSQCQDSMWEGHWILNTLVWLAERLTTPRSLFGLGKLDKR